MKKKRVLNLFKNFNKYLTKNKSKRTSININEDTINKIKTRIKINDANNYIKSRYKNGKDSTIIHLKIKIREYIRLLNNEPNLNFREKITKNIKKTSKTKSNDSQLTIIVKHLMYKSNLLHILLFYFLYFVGLNYSLVSRIMIKNFKNGFKILLLKKISKIIKHFFPRMITNLLFYYFHNSRIYETSFFFNDKKKR